MHPSTTCTNKIVTHLANLSSPLLLSPQVHFQWSSTIPNVDLSEATSSSLAFTPQDLLGNVEIGKVGEDGHIIQCCCCFHPTLITQFKL